MNNWGLNNTYDYYEFSIDSLDNSGACDSNYSPLNWPSFYVGGKTPLTDVVALKVLSASIPFTYYVFNSKNNTFKVSTFGSVYLTATIAPGNYNSVTILPALKLAIENASTGRIITPTYNSTTMKLSIESTGSLYLNFDGTILESPRNYLGFNSGIISIGGVGTIVAPNVALLSGPNYLYVNSFEFGSLTNNFIPRGLGYNGNTGPQMANVPVDVDSSEIIQYRDPGTL